MSFAYGSSAQRHPFGPDTISTSPADGSKKSGEKPNKDLGQIIKGQEVARGHQLGSKDLPQKFRYIIYELALAGAALLPLVPSILFTVFLFNDIYFGGEFVTTVRENRSSVQVVITLIAAPLTHLNTFVINDFLAACDLRLAENPFFKLLLGNIGLELWPDEDKNESLINGKAKNQSQIQDTIRNGQKFFQGKGKRKTVFSAIFGFCLLAVPHLVWTGALTPNEVSQANPDVTLPFVPSYSEDTSFNWRNNSFRNPQDCSNGFQNSIFYDGCAATALTALLFQSISMGSEPYRTGGIYSSFQYDNRSYGVGSAVGVLNIRYDPHSILENYTYLERGYSTQVKCQYNLSSAWTLETVSPSRNNGSVPGIFEAQGRFPNSDWLSDTTELPASVVGQNISDIVAWGSKSAAGQNILAIAAGSNYPNLDKIQCSIDFTPTWFQVKACMLQDLIEVRPVGPPPNGSAAADFDPGLSQSALNQLSILSTLQSPSGFSDLGQALASNIFESSSSNNDDGDEEDDFVSRPLLGAVEDSIASALDDILLYISGSQLFVNNMVAQQKTEVTPIVSKIQIGQTRYVLLAIFFTVILVLGIAVKQIFVRVYGRPTFRRSRQDLESHIGMEPEGEGFLSSTRADGGKSEMSRVTAHPASIR